jgi:hypothetical protein
LEQCHLYKRCKILHHGHQRLLPQHSHDTLGVHAHPSQCHPTRHLQTLQPERKGAQQFCHHQNTQRHVWTCAGRKIS